MVHRVAREVGLYLEVGRDRQAPLVMGMLVGLQPADLELLCMEELGGMADRRVKV